MTIRKSTAVWLGLGGALAIAACGDSGAGSGELIIGISGEAASLDGYPVGRGDDEIAFSDGWTLQFEKILVSLDAFELRTADGDSADVESGPVLVDLHQGMPELWTFDDVPARRWDRVGYRYVVPSEASRHANVDDADLETMQDGGFSLYIEARATKGDRVIPIQWGFPFELSLTRCENGRDNTDGVVVADNAVNTAQITVHLDHLFFDSFAVDAAALRFEAMAAVAPAEGPLTLEDLARQDNLSDLKDADGEPLDLAYDPGSTFNPVPKTLGDYVVSAASTTGHWNGEGHCHYRVD